MAGKGKKACFIQINSHIFVHNFFRNSVDAGWFLMEFHIAHEQVVKGRKKYLIPILLKNVNPARIQDADLRMYVESHTYLDSKDKVSCFMVFVFRTLLKWCISSCSDALNPNFQQNMQKRLLYAMPRVPLHELKPGMKNKEDANKNTQCHVGTIAEKIQNAKRGRKPAADELMKEGHKREKRNLFKILMRKKRKVKANKKTEGDKTLQDFTQLAAKMRNMEGTGLTRREKIQIRRIESRLRKVHDRQALELTPADDSVSEETSEELSSDTESTSIGSSHRGFVAAHGDMEITEVSSEVDGGGEINVAVEVHQGDEEELEGAVGGVMKEEILEGAVGGVMEEEILEGAVGGVMEEEAPIARERAAKAGEACVFVEQAQHEILSDSSIGSDHTAQKVKDWFKRNDSRNEINERRNQLKMKNMRRKDTRCKDMEESEVLWGEEESSESDSDGGWDFETGGMPLLPR